MAVRIRNAFSTYEKYSFPKEKRRNNDLSFVVVIFRYLRNKRQRREARDEQLRAVLSKVEHQVFHTRCSQSPEVLTFHPFEPHLAVALKDFFGYPFI